MRDWLKSIYRFLFMHQLPESTNARMWRVLRETEGQGFVEADPTRRAVR